MIATLAILADASNVSREGKLNILGGFNRIYAHRFPATHPAMQLVLRFECSPAELGKTRKLQVVLMDEDGASQLGNIEAQISLPEPGPGAPHQLDAAISLNNTRFEKPGLYQFSILVDDDEKASVPLTVSQTETES